MKKQQQQPHVETQQLPHKLHPLSYQSTSNITPRLLLITSQLTPQISIPLHYPHFPHTHNKLHICVVQPSPNTRSHSVLSYYGQALVTLYVQFLCRKASIFVSYIIKEFAPAFSCAYIELWMHLGSLESTQEAKGALIFTNFSCSLNFPRTSITRYTYAKYEQILKLRFNIINLNFNFNFI